MCILFLLLSFIVVYEFIFAPKGFEDNEGFHYIM